MQFRSITCREHGGSFSIPVKRGRPPTRCSDENVCDRARKSNRVVTKENTATAAQKRRSNPGISKRDVTTTKRIAVAKQSFSDQVAETRQAVKSNSKYRPVKTAATPAVVTNNPCVPLAHSAKRILEPQGWKLSGRAWFEDGVSHASLTGQRGEETISFLWSDKKLVSQEYSMWNSDKPAENGMPRKRLEFDPDEVSDIALIRLLSGRNIAWWNRLGKTVERATFPHSGDSKVKVEHLMNGHADHEVRIVTFVDGAGSGFRSFNVDALLAVK